jgi:2-polyprenyl-6-methoxyphenol hydroxylase-like FAD-dependent oxidoreductase
METTRKTDVLIVGAGPTGLALACQLLRYGVDFIILDQAETITPYSRAIGVQARTLEIYEQIGLAQSLVAQGVLAEKLKLVEEGTVRGEIELAKLGEGLSPYPFLLIVEQSKHEQLLYDFIKAQGRDVLWRTALETFTQNANGVSAKIQTADGQTQTIEAQYLVGCDGAKSLVRHALGLTFEGSTFERLFYVADVEIDWEFGHGAVVLCLARSTVTAFFPMAGEKRYRIVGTFPENEERREGEILYEEIERQIAEDTKLALDISNVNWFSVYRVHSRRVNRFSEGRCFLAGDAAHIHTPAGAQGMNTGIQDGYNLAWKLAMVLREQADTTLLETYHEERSANAKNLLATTDRIFDFGASEDPVIAFLRLHIFPRIANFALHFDAVKKYIFPLISQIGISYRESALSKPSDGDFAIHAGDRMPYFQVDDASIYDKLRAPKFHLLIFSDGISDVPNIQAGLESEYPGLVDVHVLPLQPQIAEVVGVKEDFCVLLRPDNYVAFIAKGTAWNEAKRYLSGLRAPG